MPPRCSELSHDHAAVRFSFGRLFNLYFLHASLTTYYPYRYVLYVTGDKDGAGNMARLLLAVYALGTPAITFWLVKIMHFTGLELH